MNNELPVGRPSVAAPIPGADYSMQVCGHNLRSQGTYAVGTALAGLRAYMDWRLLLTAFGIIFLGEIGDKTHVAVIAMSAESKKPMTVLIGAVLAFSCVSAASVAAGALLSQYVSLNWVKRAAACLFIVVGLLMLAGKI